MNIKASLKERLKRFFGELNKIATLICGISVLIDATGKFGFKGFLACWVLMHFGSIWRPIFEKWFDKK